MRVPRLHWLGPVGTHDEGVDGTGATSMTIGALFFAAVIFAAVPNSKSAYAQNRPVGNFGHPSGSFHGRPGFAQNRGVGNFGHFSGSFLGRGRFGGGFDRGRRDFGSNIVVVPSVVAAPPPYYDAPPPGYDSLRCFLHRHVETPNGLVLEPVYVC
jgi:hypothetical protein